MEVSCGGEARIFHARIVCKDVKFGVPLEISVAPDKIDAVRAWVKNYYEAEQVFLSYECEG